MGNTDKVKVDVLRMYMSYPYPNYSVEERRNIFAAELSRYRFLGLEQFMPNARIIDVGCGTGHRVMPLAKHFGAKKYVGLDHSAASLVVARELAKELEFKEVSIVEGDVFDLSYSDESFDIVISQGVLHHTSDPYRGFKELVRVCRPNGFINVFLYNKWNHWRHNMQKEKVNRLAGSDIERRFEVAHRLYGKKPIEQMTPSEIAGFYDQYCHPHKSEHTIGETLSWFEAEDLDYWGSYPPLRFLDFIAMAQFRGSLIEKYPYFHTKTSEMIIRMSMKLPQIPIAPPPFKTPTLLHRLFWQTVYAIQGSRGRYSGGAALCGRKRLAFHWIAWQLDPGHFKPGIRRWNRLSPSVWFPKKDHAAIDEEKAAVPQKRAGTNKTDPHDRPVADPSRTSNRTALQTVRRPEAF